MIKIGITVAIGLLGRRLVGPRAGVAAVVAVVALVGLLVGATASASASASVPWRSVGRIDSRGLTGLSCPSSSLCVAVDSAGNVLTSTKPADGVSAWTITKVDGANHLSGVSCPAVSLCVAVDRAGDVVASTNPAGGMSAWKVAHVDGANSVSAVSCPSVLLCVAVDNAGNSVVSSDPAGGSSAWTVHQIDDESYYECEHYGPYPCPPPPLVGVSCPSVSLCVAVDDAGWAIGSTAPTTPGVWSDSFGAPGGNYHGVSCVLESLCVGTCPLGVDYGGWGGCNGSSGTYYNESVVTWNPVGAAGPSAWRYTTISPSGPAGVWCRSGPLCFASDDRGRLFGSTAPAGGVSAWPIMYAARSVVTGLSCSSISTCIAVDSAGYALVGGPPPTSAQIKASLLKQLAASGRQVRIAALLKKGAYRLSLKVLTAGRVVINWYCRPKCASAGKRRAVLVATGSARFSKPGQVALSIKLTAAGKRIPRNTKTLTLTVKATYMPAAKRAIVVTKTFKPKR